MGIIIQMLDLDKKFKSLSHKLVVNEYAPEEKTKHLSLLETLLLQTIEPVLTFTPSCLCGREKNGWKLNRLCYRCNTKVTRPNNEDLEPNIWFKTYVPGVKFVAPAIYAIMDKKISSNKKKDVENENLDNPCDPSKFSLLGYISNSKGRKTKNMTNADRVMLSIIENIRGFKRDYRYFSANFVKICKVIAIAKGGNVGKEMLELLDDVEKSGKRLYGTYLPIINGKMVYRTSSNNKITPTYNLIKNLVLGYTDTPYTEEAKLNAMAVVNYKSACLYSIHLKTLIASKLGVGRKHGLASKLDFSSRNVCIPTHSINDIREVHMPYVTSIVLFRLHLANMLLRRMSLKQTYLKIRKAKVNFDQEIYDMMCSLISESKLVLDNGKPYQGIIVGRNPGLLVGSILALALTHIKSDQEDHTIEVSTPFAKLPNYDYDGDLLYITLPLSQYVYGMFKDLTPAASVISPNVPGGIYRKIGLGPIAPMNISAMLSAERERLT